MSEQRDFFQTMFARRYAAATENLLEAIASANPSKPLSMALGHANDAFNAAANTIEESLARDLIASIRKATPLILA